jgi:hypothetical protein
MLELKVLPENKRKYKESIYLLFLLLKLGSNLQNNVMEDQSITSYLHIIVEDSILENLYFTLYAEPFRFFERMKFRKVHRQMASRPCGPDDARPCSPSARKTSRRSHKQTACSRSGRGDGRQD